jgi:hypothetical protein
MQVINNPARYHTMQEVLWVGDVLLVSYFQTPRTPSEHEIAIRREDCIDKIYAIRHFQTIKIHESYADVTLGFVGGKPACGSGINGVRSFRRPPSWGPSNTTAHYNYLDPSLLDKPVAAQPVASGSRAFVVAEAGPASRGTNVLAFSGIVLNYRPASSPADLLPQHITAELRQSPKKGQPMFFDRYSFLIYHYGSGAHRVYKIDKPVTAIAVAPDDLTVAVFTREKIHFFDVDV